MWVLVTVAALLQGITEFLPVSSSGHLRISAHLFGFDGPTTALDVSLHVATLLAVLWVFRRDIGQLLRRPGSSETEPGRWRVVGLLAVGTVPAGAVGLIFGDALEAWSTDLAVVGGSYLVNAGILLLAHRAGRPGGTLAEMRWWHALLIGLAQALAVQRGISRAGCTITAGLLLGFRPSDAAFFSFLLAFPVIGGAALLMIDTLATGAAWGPLCLGFVLSFVTGVVALRVLLASARKALWWPYALYSLVLAGVCIAIS